MEYPRIRIRHLAVCIYITQNVSRSPFAAPSQRLHSIRVTRMYFSTVVCVCVQFFFFVLSLTPSFPSISRSVRLSFVPSSLFLLLFLFHRRKLCAHINTLELSLHGQFFVVVIYIYFVLFSPSLPLRCRRQFVGILRFTFFSGINLRIGNAIVMNSRDFCFDFVVLFVKRATFACFTSCHCDAKRERKKYGEAKESKKKAAQTRIVTFMSARACLYQQTEGEKCVLFSLSLVKPPKNAIKVKVCTTKATRTKRTNGTCWVARTISRPTAVDWVKL